MSDTFHSDIPDLSKFMKSLDMLDENVSKATVTGLKKGAEIIVNAQKRRIAAKSQVYIPRWIDLKEIPHDRLRSCGMDLHSNMDRFESRDTLAVNSTSL